ncbi:MAG TPA: M1 family aminopeptidase, partial [Longimicrobiales bacterium]|nr:M1 family aminopeptidase [Longimicrobiales bacterium]
RGFGDTIAPWLWFKLYWTAWAVMLAVVGRLLWVRGLEVSVGKRLRLAGQRFTRANVTIAVFATTLILSLGGFIYYNTNVINDYISDDELADLRAQYEIRYGKYEGIPQPRPTATTLRIEVEPKRGTATTHGSYRMLNIGTTPIAEIHLEPAFYVETKMSFDRPAKLVVDDKELGHVIYALNEPLQPGDSLTLNFDVKLNSRGFRSGGSRVSGAGTAILDNGSFFTSTALPVIGYQPRRELWSAEDRRKYHLPRQLTILPPSDIDPNVSVDLGSIYDAVISTDSDQVAVAPGELRRTWTEGGRRYFHYASDVPIIGMAVFASANYKVHRERWKDVDIQVFVHPPHAKHLDRLMRSVRASLEYNSSQFGEYPHRFLQIVEQPGDFLGMGVDGSGVVTGGEGFFLLDPRHEGFDAIFEIVAHELGHQWWGMQLKTAFAEGGGVISESLAWYSALELVKNVKGREALRRLMHLMREPNPWPPIHTGLPLLRAMDPWANYRKGPYAMHALSEYVGEARVNLALRTLVAKKKSSLATTLDMYRELQVVTPDSLKPLLHDLFEVNVLWKFDTKKVTARKTAAGTWEVTFDVDAHKLLSDSAGGEKEVPINEMIELGVFADAERGLGKTLYLQKHRIRTGRQTIKIVVHEKPARGGIDPYNLLDWEEGDNIEQVYSPHAA